MNEMIVIEPLKNGQWKVRVVKGQSHSKNRLNEKGQGLVEYILIVVLMGILAIGALTQMGDTTQDGFDKSTRAMNREFQKIR